MPSSVDTTDSLFDHDTLWKVFLLALLIAGLGVGFELGGAAAGDPIDLPILVAVCSGVVATGLALVAERDRR